MNFYYLVCEQEDGFKFIVPGTLFSSLKEAQEYYNGYRTDLYKSVEIKTTSVPLENLITALVKSLLNNSPWTNDLREIVLPNPNK
jgi:hypothetical protein